MAPNKFEEHIKEKLDKRTINPSIEAWGKLSDRLDNQEKKKNTKPYWWFGVAASIVGVLLVVSQFLNNETTINNNEEIVDSPIIKEDTILIDSRITIAKDTYKEDGFNKLEKENKLNKEEPSIKSNSIIKGNNLIEAVVGIPKKETVIQKSKIKVKSDEVLKKKLSFEDKKIQEVVAQVQGLKKDNKAVTDAEIDALLFEAQKEIKLNSLLNNETTGMVDANALLQDVEAELDQSFRNKVFKALKSSYNSVKTAVAQRNDYINQSK